jgi:hypothetical protein
MKFGTWIMAMVEPMLAKVLLGLGFSVVSIVGMDTVIGSLKSEIVTSFMALPPDVVNFALYLWLGKGIGIIFGAITTKMALWSIQNATSLLGRSNG